MAVHILDEMSVNGRCGVCVWGGSKFFFFSNDSVGSYFYIPVLCLELHFDINGGFLKTVFQVPCKVCQFVTILSLKAPCSADV